MIKKRSGGAFPLRMGGAQALKTNLFAGLLALSLISSLLVQPAKAHDENSVDPDILSDREFASQLMRNSGVAVPEFFGCNRIVRTNPELPIVCFHQIIQVRIERLPDTGLNVFALVSGVPETDWWERAAGVKQLDFFNWGLERTSFFHQIERGKSILCLIGRPKSENSRAVELGACLRTFPDTYRPDEGSTLRITFEDLGVFQVLGPNRRRDEVALKSFVTYFAMNVWSSY